MSKVSQLLTTAAQKIREKGWFSTFQEQVTITALCPSMAINEGLNLLELTDATLSREAHIALLNVLGIIPEERTKDIFQQVYDWNDSPERTAGEVIEALERAAIFWTQPAIYVNSIPLYREEVETMAMENLQ